MTLSIVPIDMGEANAYIADREGLLENCRQLVREECQRSDQLRGRVIELQDALHTTGIEGGEIVGELKARIEVLTLQNTQLELNLESVANMNVNQAEMMAAYRKIIHHISGYDFTADPRDWTFAAAWGDMSSRFTDREQIRTLTNDLEESARQCYELEMKLRGSEEALEIQATRARRLMARIYTIENTVSAVQAGQHDAF